MTPGPVSTCPECGTAAVPYDAEWDPGGCLSFYDCTRCGHEWQKPWMLSEAEMTMFREGAA